MEVIRVFLIFGLVTPILSFNLTREGKCGVFRRHFYISIRKKCSLVLGYYINLDSNEQLVVRKHRVAGIGRLPTRYYSNLLYLIRIHCKLIIYNELVLIYMF